MGCGQSKRPANIDLTSHQTFKTPGSVPPERLSVLLPKTGPLPENNYWNRLSLSSQPHEVDLSRSKFNVRYAFTSLRGFYPDALQKSNQDEVCAHQLVTGENEQLLFAVFDGHGSEGHLCAQYAKNKVSSRQLLLRVTCCSDPSPARLMACWHCCLPPKILCEGIRQSAEVVCTAVLSPDSLVCSSPAFARPLSDIVNSAVMIYYQTP